MILILSLHDISKIRIYLFFPLQNMSTIFNNKKFANYLITDFGPMTFYQS